MRKRLPFVIGRTARYKTVSGHGGLEGWTVPLLDRVRWLHIVVPVEEHGGLARGAAPLTVDQRVARRLDSPGLQSGLRQLFGDQLAAALHQDSGISMATAANPINDDEAMHDPNVVKCVIAQNGEALYFSRSPIPFQRAASPGLNLYRHKGIYAYRRDFLEKFVVWPPSPLELAESLEQLRALENNARIKVLITDDDSTGVDTLEQAQHIETLLK